MKFLVFDTETNGLPKNWKAPMSLLTNWPRVIQMAYILFDEDGKDLFRESAVIHPDKWEVPNEKFWQDNGHSTERCFTQGVDMPIILDSFVEMINSADYLVAHNMNFDYNIVGAEMIRYKKKATQRPKICTMISTIDFCNLPGNYGKPKFPKLEELHRMLFNEEFEGAHDALDDVMATKKCFLELLKLQVIELL